MRVKLPVLRRFLTKFVHDMLPAALASLLGSFLLTHYGVFINGSALAPAVQATPASAEMMDVLRDEHALIADFVKAQVANEKQQLAAEDAASRASAEGASAAVRVVAPASRQPNVVAAAAKPVTPRDKTPAVGVSLQPLVIAELQHGDTVDNAMIRNEESLLAKTKAIKDHVMSVTHRAISAIGGIPSWFGAIGDLIGGGDNPRPPANLVSAS
jgi:hypothetical protein